MKNIAQGFGKKLAFAIALSSLVCTSSTFATETGNSNGGSTLPRQDPAPRQDTANGTSNANANSPTSIDQNTIGSASSGSIENLNKEAAGKTKKTSALAMIASAVAIGVSVYNYGLYATCTASSGGPSCTPKLVKAIAYAVAGVAIMLVSKKQKSKSKEFTAAANQVRAGGNGTDDEGDLYDLDGDGDIDDQDDVIFRRNNANQVAQIRRLRELGVIIDPNTGEVRMPDGRRFNAGTDLNSTASMAAAGLTPAEIAAFGDAANASMAQANAATDSATSTPELFDGSIGGGGGGSNAGNGSGETEGLPGSGGGTPNDRAPASVAGLSRDFNGEPIGVAGDSLFLMMHRRYDFHETQGTFGVIPP